MIRASSTESNSSPGIVLADTPGTGSVHAHNTQSTAAFLPRVDVALLVLSVTAPLSDAEAHLLTAVGETAARAAVCLSMKRAWASRG